MPELSYRYRAHPFARARTYRLSDEALVVADGPRERAIRYADIVFIESFTVRYLDSAKLFARRIMHPADGGPPVVLGAAFRDRWLLNDRSAEYETFITALHARITAANPDHQWINGRYWLNRAGGLGGKVAVALTRMVRHTNPDRWADVAAWVMRRLGPRLRGHRRALQQLAMAFPEKSADERQQIAVGMWDNLARTMVEYAQLDTLWDYDPARPEQGRVSVDESTARIWADLRAANQRALGFSMHSGNWELIGVSIPKHGLKSLVPYRRPKNLSIVNELFRIRVAGGCTPIAAGPLMIADIKRQFQPGVVLGMLIDQHYVHGIDVTFFGRPTRLNPLFARLARIYNCPVYAARVIRLPGRRFRYEAAGPLELPRDPRGHIDVPATTQMLASQMERWIREHPEQWMWLQPVWR